MQFFHVLSDAPVKKQKNNHREHRGRDARHKYEKNFLFLISGLCELVVLFFHGNC